MKRVLILSLLFVARGLFCAALLEETNAEIINRWKRVFKSVDSTASVCPSGDSWTLFFGSDNFKGIRGIKNDRGSYTDPDLLKLDFNRFFDPSAGDIKLRRELVRYYKIHIMPSLEGEWYKETLVRILAAAKDDTEFGKLIALAKFPRKNELIIHKKKVYPRVIIYPIQGKEAAQALVEKLYTVLSGIPPLAPYQLSLEQLESVEGSIVPRFNAKLTNLIFYAQGDADAKFENVNVYDFVEKRFKSFVVRDMCFDLDNNFATYNPEFIPGEYANYNLRLLPVPSSHPRDALARALERERGKPAIGRRIVSPFYAEPPPEGKEVVSPMRGVVGRDVRKERVLVRGPGLPKRVVRPV
ncbi:hypothetical protein HN446_05060, partial [bacterium]|nr:hypothetical protein [bacterium]